MSAITTQYNKIINNLIAVPIPTDPNSSLITEYLSLINNLKKLEQIDNNMVSTTDQAVVFSDLGLYNSTMSDLLSNLKVLDIFFKIQR